MSCRHGCNPECDECWEEAFTDTVWRNGPGAVDRIEAHDDCDCGQDAKYTIPEPGMFGQPTALLAVDWLQTAEDDFLRMAQELKPWFHRLIGWLGRI